MFSTSIKDYKALAYFEVSMDFKSPKGNFNENYGFHVPVVQEQDGNFYALCLELNQVAYSHKIERSIERMHEFLTDFVSEVFDSNNNWVGIYDEMDEEYFNIFHKLKGEYNRRKAEKLTLYLQKSGDSEPGIIKNIEKKEIFTINTKLGKVDIEKKYQISTLSLIA